MRGVSALPDDAHNPVVLIQRNTVRTTIAIVIVPALENATSSVRPRDDLGSAIAIGVREVDAHWIGTYPLAHLVAVLALSAAQTPDHLGQRSGICAIWIAITIAVVATIDSALAVPTIPVVAAIVVASAIPIVTIDDATTTSRCRHACIRA